jgi:hypothetical protein
MHKTARQGLFKLASALKDQVWPMRIHRPWLFGLAIVLLGAGLIIASLDFIHAYRDDINAVATIVIAIFTAVLGIFTVNLARSTQMAAEAAKAAADAAVATDRATLYTVEVGENLTNIMKMVSALNGPWDSSHFSTIPLVRICFKNYGNTPCRVQTMCYGLKFSREPFDFICEPINYKEAILEAGQATNEIEVRCDDYITTRQAKDIQEGHGYMWLYGRVYYKDVFDVPHVHKFYRRFARIGEFQYGMRSYDYKDYNTST